MEATLPEILDKISILKIKLEHAEADVKINLFSELDECIKSLRLFEDKGIKVKQEWSGALYDANKEGWELYDRMAREEKKENPDFVEMGRIYIDMQIANKKRVAVKNQITEETGEGFKDVKIN